MAKPYPAGDLGRYRLTLENTALCGTVYWGRVVSSERESLLTQYTKHTFFEIQYALEGRIVMTIGSGTSVCLHEAELIVIPPDTYHQIIDADNTGARFIMAFSAEGKTDAVRAALSELMTPVPVKETSYLRTVLQLILEKCTQSSPFCREELTALTESFLLELLRMVSPAHAAAPQQLPNGEKLVETALDYIREPGGIGVSVSELARSFNFSERHLNRLFRTYTGKSVHEAIAFEKLHHIETLISTTMLSFGEIAELCGFCDAYAMNKFFKHYTYLRLSDYRRLCAQKTK